MAKKRKSSGGQSLSGVNNPKTTYSTSGYSGSRRGLTKVDDNGNRSASHNGQFVTRKQTYRDLRAAFGLATG